MRPLLSYYGGDQRLAHVLLPIVELIHHSIYVEVFAGGCALFFAKARHYGNSHYYREVLNDTNQLVYRTYKAAIEQPDELQRRLDLTPHSHDFYRDAKTICKHQGDFEDLDVAVATIINCRQSFANKMGNGWACSLKSTNHPRAWNAYKGSLSQILGRLSTAYIDNVDAIYCIKKWDTPDTLFYCDPPFLGTDQGYYSGYTEQQYQELCSALDDCTGSYILQNYPQEIVPKSATEIRRAETTVSASRSTNNDRRTTMLWIKNNHARDRTQLSLF